MFQLTNGGRLAALLLASTALASPSFAEELDQANPTVDELVVTGQREAQRKAIEVKRDAFTVTDSVSADDIGKLPDHNTAAALRRIPGVSVMEDQGEPRFPTLRGLTSTYNRTTIDGATVASVDSAGRTVPLDIVPSVMAGRIEVVKTVTPDMDANAIGGVINVVTRSAFDARGPFLSAMGSYGKFEQHGDVRNDDPAYRLSFAAGTRFGPDEQFGIVIGGSLEQRDYDIPQVESANPSIREYTAAGAPVDSGDPRGNAIQVPFQQRLFWYNNTKQRKGVNGKIEWRPNEDFRIDASAIYATMEDDEQRIENRLEPLGNVSNQTQTSGTFLRGRNIIHINRPITTRSLGIVRSDLEWHANPRTVVTGGVAYSKSKLEEDNTSDEFRTNDAQGANYGFNYDTSQFFFRFIPLNEAAVRNPANHLFNNHRIALSVADEEVTQAHADVAFDTGWLDDSLTLKFGAAGRSTLKSVDADQATYTARSGFIYTLAQVAEEGPEELIQGVYRLNPRIGDRAAIDFFNANRSSFVESLNNVASDFKVSEDVAAAYAQFIFERGPLTVIGGLRYERTEVDTSSTRALNGGFSPVSASGSYDNWLPGLHLKYALRDDLIVRAAWTNTIGRPNFADITAREAITFSGSQAVLSRGNPNLKPRESEGFDLSVEFYPRDGLLALGVFRKNIENEIFTLNSVEQIDLGIGRGPEPVSVSAPRNAQPATINGLEIAWQQALTMLPQPLDGFGFNLNVTLLDSEFMFVTDTGARETGFFQQPDIVTNESIYYQRGPLEARISHNYIGGFLETVNAVPNADQYWKGRHSFDANVSWRINDHFTVFAEGENLSNSGRQENTGPFRRNLQESAEYGRTYWVGLQASF
ncbi:TonB-dependent receptor [Phenylobacterium deserti]|uniref:TonB-dependent receptor n=1 Tax=Phenylobacterium deserti TaxID=1914756 RepID=A0A328AQ41_9CAUL|nr:TonB-dependent receptor [Phenylobacterium deserti]RAK56689.1 TonB-dependent receptor [Phenylobacterium deserti]